MGGKYLGLLSWSGGGGWNPCFSRPFNDWEVESFLVRLHGKRVSGDVEDLVLWTDTKSGKFSVKSLYNALELGDLELGDSFSFPSSCIWATLRVQPMISFFAWATS